MSKKHIVEWIERNQTSFDDLADQIWAQPELAYEERFATESQIGVLQHAGFRITGEVGGMPTAFIAEYGSGTPVIGIIGEYDALPGLSQRVSASPEPIVHNGAGHGCGHNLLGTAGVEAAIAIADRLLTEGLPGTVRYYGCPAEEVLSGKTFMAREGVFDDLDAALTWHPGSSNLAVSAGTSALTSVEFHFHGRTAHAGAAPHLGRSALDAVELMNVGANYLREHVPDGSRIHYTITNGGIVPNIVPDQASVWYFLRGANREHVDGLLERLLNIARGAALMTETTVTWEIKAGAYDFKPNETLNDLLVQQWDEAGPLAFTEEERTWANTLTDSLDPAALRQAQQQLERLGLGEEGPLPTGFARWKPVGVTLGGSTDLGDVSWITPVGTVTTTCAPVGVQVHTWQATASFGSSIGRKGMQYAAKLIALAAYDLFTNEETLSRAKEEFRQATHQRAYVPAIPSHVQPPISRSDRVEVSR
ncbi:aminobenzoyl-glutamate utilization protein B [Paenibacillus cellulosilyticus]|uniref:Aminobenzoyl-glutamate utilization protein B n=1 Tax=Paenibacillus cellulosilyticus TaxID=375489 RepID=A0A2V2YV30_9BACL|nr:amidohydrolase [Paenibacillus cellulosilyticus]PWW04827.1 aminobenzoyl-glutamate utilization protein B [Paenibacillus cellulosilyticus]QKS45944.1 amidohydrolase [Paenibacillus cellulosilyticus]